MLLSHHSLCLKSSLLAGLVFFGGALCTYSQPLLAELQPLESDSLSRNISMDDFRYERLAGIEISNPGIFGSIQTKPGVAFLSSALLPGLGQAANDDWIRAGSYLLADIFFLAMHIDKSNRARNQERAYKQFANNNWSVVTYAKWLVNYYEQNGISNEHITKLENRINGVTPSYDPDKDWAAVDIELLRSVERNTPFITQGGPGYNFSHVMPNYGSQQYYELISKYYQFGPGWRNFGVNSNGQQLDNKYILRWDESSMPLNFIEGASLAEQFNNSYRTAGNMLSLILLNHVISAFDAFITVKIKNNRLETETSLFSAEQVTLKYHF